MKEALYEAVMQDAERYEDLARRAGASEEDELARFFREIRDENRRRTEQARGLLAGRAGPGGRAGRRGDGRRRRTGRARRLLAGRVAPERDEGRPRLDRSRLKAWVGGS